jgi:tetratricopeptide (TPR) repeat protein
MRGPGILAAGFAAVLIAQPAPITSALAGPDPAPDTLDRCVNSHGTTLSLDEIIVACTSSIDSGAYTGATLAQAFNRRGLMLLRKKDFDHARIDFGKSLQSDPNFIDAYNNRSVANRVLGDADAAISDANSALRINAEDATAWLNLGSAYSYKGDLDSSLTDIGKAIAINPKLPAAYLNRGFAIEALSGDDERAIGDFDAAIALNPAYALAFSNRGWAQRQEAIKSRTEPEKQKYEALALSDANTAIQLAPTLDDGFMTRGYVWLDTRQTKRALDDFSEAIRLVPKQLSLTGRGLAYEQAENTNLAIADYAAALSLPVRHVIDSRAQEVARQRLAALGSKPTAPPPVAAPAASDPSRPALALAPPCGPGARRVALVVGNSAYPGDARLTNPANDADDVSTILRDKLCFTVIEAKDATLAVFSRKIGEFAEAAQGAEVALFYYAGHGMQFQGANLLIPVDARFDNEYDALHGNVSAQDMLALLESRARVSLVFLDACRNNPIEEAFQRRIREAGRGFGDSRGLAPMTTHGSETLVVFATRPNERAADGTGRNSPFAQAFLESIATPGEDIELIMRDISAKVRERTGGRQVPQRLTELEHGLTLVPAH